jgi:hypothetical protein
MRLVGRKSVVIISVPEIHFKAHRTRNVYAAVGAMYLADRNYCKMAQLLCDKEDIYHVSSVIPKVAGVCTRYFKTKKNRHLSVFFFYTNSS